MFNSHVELTEGTQHCVRMWGKWWCEGNDGIFHIDNLYVFFYRYVSLQEGRHLCFFTKVLKHRGHFQPADARRIEDLSYHQLQRRVWNSCKGVLLGWRDFTKFHPECLGGAWLVWGEVALEHVLVSPAFHQLNGSIDIGAWLMIDDWWLSGFVNEVFKHH